MNLNPDPTKQAWEVIYSCKTKKIPHPPLVFNNVNVTQSINQKHPASYSKLACENHLEMVATKINKAIGLFHKLQNLLPRATLKQYIKLL